MKSLFTLFTDVPNAQKASEDLLEIGFTEAEMNAVVLTDIADESLEINRKTIRTDKTGEVGEKVVRGFASLVGGQQPVDLPDVGRVYAAGDIATLVADSAGDPHRESTDNLEHSLADSGLSSDAAHIYAEGVSGGKVLFWIHGEDDKVPGAVPVFREMKGQHVQQVP